jgi:hypothetical protein
MVTNMLARLVADTPAVLRAGERPRPGGASWGWDQLGTIAAGAALMAAVCWFAMLVVRRRRERSSDSPWLLFKELCAAHGLSGRERKLLARLAQQRQLAHPAALFVEAGHFRQQGLGPAWTRSLPELERLRRRLFAAR